MPPLILTKANTAPTQAQLLRAEHALDQMLLSPVRIPSMPLYFADSNDSLEALVVAAIKRHDIVMQLLEQRIMRDGDKPISPKETSRATKSRNNYGSSSDDAHNLDGALFAKVRRLIEKKSELSEKTDEYGNVTSTETGGAFLGDKYPLLLGINMFLDASCPMPADYDRRFKNLTARTNDRYGDTGEQVLLTFLPGAHNPNEMTDGKKVRSVTAHFHKAISNGFGPLLEYWEHRNMFPNKTIPLQMAYSARLALEKRDKNILTRLGHCYHTANVYGTSFVGSRLANMLQALDSYGAPAESMLLGDLYYVRDLLQDKFAAFPHPHNLFTVELGNAPLLHRAKFLLRSDLFGEILDPAMAAVMGLGVKPPAHFLPKHGTAEAAVNGNTHESFNVVTNEFATKPDTNDIVYLRWVLSALQPFMSVLRSTLQQHVMTLLAAKLANKKELVSLSWSALKILTNLAIGMFDELELIYTGIKPWLHIIMSRQLQQMYEYAPLYDLQRLSFSGTSEYGCAFNACHTEAGLRYDINFMNFAPGSYARDAMAYSGIEDNKHKYAHDHNELALPSRQNMFVRDLLQGSEFSTHMLVNFQAFMKSHDFAADGKATKGTPENYSEFRMLAILPELADLQTKLRETAKRSPLPDEITAAYGAPSSASFWRFVNLSAIGFGGGAISTDTATTLAKFLQRNPVATNRDVLKPMLDACAMMPDKDKNGSKLQLHYLRHALELITNSAKEPNKILHLVDDAISTTKHKHSEDSTLRAGVTRTNTRRRRYRSETYSSMCLALTNFLPSGPGAPLWLRSFDETSDKEDFYPDKILRRYYSDNTPFVFARHGVVCGLQKSVLAFEIFEDPIMLDTAWIEARKMLAEDSRGKDPLTWSKGLELAKYDASRYPGPGHIDFFKYNDKLAVLIMIAYYRCRERILPYLKTVSPSHQKQIMNTLMLSSLAGGEKFYDRVNEVIAETQEMVTYLLSLGKHLHGFGKVSANEIRETLASNIADLLL